MISIEELKEMFDPVLKEYDVQLYDLKWTGTTNNRNLEVSILREDGSMDLDTCALVNERLSELLDTVDSLNSAYTLEVCSPGAEREVRDLEELKHIKQPYVCVRLKKPIDKKLEYTGELEITEDGYKLNYRDKTRTKAITFHKDDIEKIRFAVRI